MVCRKQKIRATAAADTFKKLQLLRSITNSHAYSKSSIILDATKYIQELKQKLETMNQENIAAATATSSQTCSGGHQNLLPVLRVETQEKGFEIKVFIEGSSCYGLLVFILEAFEELGIEVLQARVSCSDSFVFEANGAKGNNGGDDPMDDQMVAEAVLQAIQNWSEVGKQD